MSKYNHLRILKKVKARTQHVCQKCDQEILPTENYYREHIEDKFLHSLSPRNIAYLVTKNTEMIYCYYRRDETSSPKEPNQTTKMTTKDIIDYPVNRHCDYLLSLRQTIKTVGGRIYIPPLSIVIRVIQNNHLYGS